MNTTQLIYIALIIFIIVIYVTLNKTLFKKKQKRYKTQEEILAELSLSIELNPKDHLALYERGKIKLKLGKQKESIKDFKKAFQLGNKDAKEILKKIDPDLIKDKSQNENQTESTLLDVSNKDDYVKKSLADFDKLINSNPSNSVAYLMRGDLKEINDDLTGALLDFSEAIKIKHDYVEAYLRRGKLKLKLLDKKGACKDFNKALELGHPQARKFIDKYCV